MDNNKVIEAMQKLLDNNIDRMKEDFSILLSVVTNSKEGKAEEKALAQAPGPVSSDVSLPFFTDTTKNVIVQNEEKAKAEPKKSKDLKPSNIDITEYVSKIYPITNDKDYIKNVTVFFNKKAPGMTINEFFINCDLCGGVIHYKRFYSFQALSDIYNAYTGSDSTADDIFDAIAKPEYLKGVDIYQLEGKYAFGFKGIQAIKNNMLNHSMDSLYASSKKEPQPLSSFTDDENIVKEEESKDGLNNIQEVKSNSDKVSIASFIVSELDIDSVIKEDMTFKSMAEAYNRKYNKKVLPRSVRNVFALNEVQPTAIFGERKFRVHGHDMAILVKELRKKLGIESDLHETTVQNAPEAEKKIGCEYTENDTRGMSYSLREKFAGLVL